MFRFSKFLLASFVLGMGVFLTGCQSNEKPAQSSLAPSDTGVVCTKCQVTWVKVPVTAGGGKEWKVVGYRDEKRHECPDCREAVSNFFATGKLEHTCKTCGDTMEICKAH